MTTSGGERWQSVQDALWAALQHAPATRQAFLAEAYAADPELLAEVRSLLQAHDRSGDFLGDPISLSSGSSRPDGTGRIRRLFEELDHADSSRSGEPHALRREMDALLQLCEPGLGLLRGRDPPSPPDPLVDSTIAHYHIAEKLGEGGMGVVYKARDTRLDRVVALKFLPPHLDTDDEARARLVREAKAASALDHVNICTIHGIGETDAGQVFIAMACYAGETLETKMERGALPLEESLSYAMEVAQGLAAAHEQGLVHRDVKPANVMVTEDGVVKLLDFGLARTADVSLSNTAPLRATVAYMSPEQALGKTVDYRTDLWSLGVMLYEMLADRRPFRGDHARAIVQAILNDEPDPVVGPQTDMPAVLERVLNRTLAKRPAERYDRIQDLIGDLQLARRAADESGTGGAVPTTTRSGPTRGPGRAGRLLPEGERVQVSVVAFTLDMPIEPVREATGDHPDPLLSRIRDHATQVVHRRGGIVQRSAGDEIVAIFGVPTPREDDCVQAARASLELHTWLRGQVDAGVVPEMKLRSGIDTGLAVARQPGQGEQGHRIIGPPLLVAARLAQHAGVDQILASPATRRLLAPFFEIEDHDPVRWKGLARPVTPGRIVAASASRSRLDAADPAWLTPYVGRKAEMEALNHGLQRAMAGEGQLVTVVGEAGLGKSRLLYEFRRGLERDGGGIVEGRCSSDGDVIPFQPFIEALRDHLPIGPGTPGEVGADRVVEGVLEAGPELQPYIPLYLHLLSLPGGAHPLPEHLKGEPLDRALLEALVALFTRSARRDPMVLFLEDWHASDRASRKVLDRLVELLPAYPLMVVVTFRPEYGPGWDHPAHQTTLRLRPLERGPSFAIMRSALHAADLPEAFGALLHERTGGNPFFLEEICHALEEEGTLEVEEGRVTRVRSIHGLRLPNTVQAVIRTRLHRLDREARRVLGQAAVAGRVFTRELLRHALGGEQANASLDASLVALRGAGLIHQTDVLPEATYRFRHVLTREVAYDSLLQHQRQRMHGRMAEAIEARYADGLEEHAEALVHQFGEAKRWRKVVRYSRLAAERSYRVGQLPETVALYERARTALERLPEGAERRETLIELLLRQERLYEEIAGYEEQQAAIDELFVLLDGVGDPETLAETHVRQGDLHILQGRFQQAEDALNEALRVSRTGAHLPGELMALRSMGFLRWHQDRHPEAVSINEELVALDRQNGDIEPLVTDLLNFLTVLRRMKYFERGLVCVEELLVLSEQIEDPVRQLPLYNNIGEFYRGLGDHARALHYLDRAMEIAEQNHYLGSHTYQMGIRAQVLFEQGRIEESIQCYQDAIARHRSSPFPIGAPGSAHARGPAGLAGLLRRLGELLAALQRDEEALPYLEEAAALSGWLQDPETEALLRSKVAVLHEGRERHPAAQVEWERVRGLCRGAGDIAGECRALEGLGRTARTQQDVARALSSFRDALRLAERTGDQARQGELHNTIGILVGRRGAYAEALAHYEQALRIYEVREQRIHVGLMLNSIGATLQRLGRSEEAVGRLEEAIRLHRRTAQRQLEAYALGVLGDVHFGMDRHAEALACYVASLALRPDLGDRRGEGWMLHRMARVYAAQGRGARSRSAGARAAAIAEDIGDQELSETCRSFMGAAEA